MVARFGDLLCVVSDDLFCDEQNQQGLQSCSSATAHQLEDFELVLQTITSKPRVVVCDDGNTQFQDFARKLTTALALGVKMQNFAWFVFDGGLPDAEEVEVLINLQQKRVKDFLANKTRQDAQHFRASDGKIVSSETIRRAVLQLRSQYFVNGTELRIWNAEYIIHQLLEYAKAQYGCPSSPPSYALEKFSSGLLAGVPPHQLVLDGAWSNGIINGCGGPPLLAPSLDGFTTVDGLGTHAALQPATSSTSPIIGLPTDLNSISKGFQDAFATASADQLLGPMYFVLADGQKLTDGLQETPPLQQQLNFPSSAASPPFTSTNPVMHNGDLSETQGPLAASSAASSALLTGNNPALRSGDLSDTSASIASSSFAPPAGKMCFNNTPRKTVESEDDFSMFSRLHTASQRSVTVSPRSLGPLQMLQTAEEPTNGGQSGKSGKPEKNPKPRKEARKTGNGAAAKGTSKANGNGNGNGNGHGNGNGNGKNGRKSKVGWGGTTQNCSTTTDAKGELTLQSVLNDYWKTHKLEIVDDFDIKVPGDLQSGSASAAIQETDTLDNLAVEDAMQAVASPVC
jgi:hypothetical protein